MEFALGLSIAAVLLAAVALARAYVPPQGRAVKELVRDVDELIEHVSLLDKRLISRGSRENMDKARAAHEERKARRDKIEEEATAILAAAKAAPPAPLDEHEQRAAIRRKIGLHH